jgi:hypothetical protein
MKKDLRRALIGLAAAVVGAGIVVPLQPSARTSTAPSTDAGTAVGLTLWLVFRVLQRRRRDRQSGS